MRASSEMPQGYIDSEVNKFNWLNSLQPCSITVVELDKVINHLYLSYTVEEIDNNQIEVTNIVEDIGLHCGIWYDKIVFKHPTKVESLQTMINKKIEWANKRVEITDKPFTIGQKQVLTFILNEIVNECLKPIKADETKEAVESQDELWERVISQTEFMDRRGEGIKIGIEYFNKQFTIIRKK